VKIAHRILRPVHCTDLLSSRFKLHGLPLSRLLRCYIPYVYPSARTALANQFPHGLAANLT